jgi:hypothetical protein
VPLILFLLVIIFLMSMLFVLFLSSIVCITLFPVVFQDKIRAYFRHKQS